MPDQDLEVGAVHRRLPEAFAGAVAVRVVPAPAHLHQLTGTASGGEGVAPELAGGEPGVVEELVEAVGGEGHPGGGGALVRGFQRIGLFDGAVGLDHGGGGGLEPEGLGGGGQAEQQGDDLLEEPDPGAP